MSFAYNYIRPLAVYFLVVEVTVEPLLTYSGDNP